MDAKDYFHRGWEEYLRHLPEEASHPMEVLVLRGHLLIERQLVQLIEIHLPNPEALDLNRMRFGSKVRLARALCGHVVRQWIWDALGTINSLRNALAHKLGNPKVQDLAVALVNMVQKSDPLTFELVARKSLDEQLSYSLAWVHERMLNECINRSEA